MKSLEDMREDVLGILSKLSRIVPENPQDQMALDHVLSDLTRIHFDLRSIEDSLQAMLRGSSTVLIIPPANPSFSGWRPDRP